ncbi:GIY-YIG nuclease family protein [Candidatus Saccharibacteria bacterium]|nr:GIY-YIG nuclease family protein [Candidatus Saccharibacteria bacterium]
MSEGYVYILVNPVMPGIIKIGFTKDIKRRLRDLDTTGVPQPYEPYFSVKTKKYQLLEKVIHRELDKLTDSRLRNNREFFKMDPDVARDLLLNVSQLLDDAEIDDYGNKTAEDAISEDGKVHPMSSRTTFEMLGIPVGTVLEPVTEVCPVVKTVDDKNSVCILDTMEIKTISRVVVDAYGTPHNGFDYYRYNGEVLSKIRQRIDKNYRPSQQR